MGGARLSGDVLELIERLVGRNNLQRSGAAIADPHSSVARYAIDKRVVHLEASRREGQKRAAKSFEVRDKHSRRRLCRSQPGATTIEQRHRRAAGDELMGDRFSDNPCANDDDVTIWHYLGLS